MDIENYIRSFGIKTFVTKAVRHVLLKNDSTIAWKINNYNEKNIENYLEKTIFVKRINAPFLFAFERIFRALNKFSLMKPQYSNSKNNFRLLLF